jgi:hypothetical protein
MAELCVSWLLDSGHAEFAKEAGFIERLDEVLVGARFKSSFYVVIFGFSGDHDDFGGVEGRIGSDSTEQINAGHNRHVPVDEGYGKGPGAAETEEALLAVGGLDALDVALGKKRVDIVPDKARIVNDQGAHESPFCFR